MSANEKEYDLKIEPEKHIIIRLDGHKFSKFTKQFVSPFDDVIGRSMEMVAIDLVNEFNCHSGYVQSDEITLVKISLLSKENPDWNHSYNGRVQKMASLIASFATVRFNLHMKKLHIEYKDCVYIGSDAMFDCRVYGVPSEQHVFEEFFMRMRSAERNSRSVFAQSYCIHKSLQNLNGKELVEKCLKETGNDWNQLDDKYKYGTIVKKVEEKQYIQNEWFEGYAIRHPVKTLSKKFIFSQDNMDLIMSKYMENLTNV